MQNKKFGYGRVSTLDQNLDRQLIKFQELGIEERDIFTDKMSGKNFNRENYQALKRVVRAGDIIYLDDLDRLGRNYDEIIKEWKYITRELNVDIVILDKEEIFDSRKFREMGDLGKLLEDQFLSLLSYVAEQERKNKLRQQKEGIAAAKRAGKHLGRPRITIDTLTSEQKKLLTTHYDDWEKGLIKAVDFMKLLNVKKNTFYKLMKEYQEKLKK